MTGLDSVLLEELCYFAEDSKIQLEIIRTDLFAINRLCEEAEGTALEPVLIRTRVRIMRIRLPFDRIICDFLRLHDRRDGRGLVINSEWLSVFFARKILRSETLSFYLQDSRCDVENSIFFFKKLSAFFLFILHTIRTHSVHEWIRYTDARPDAYMKSKLFLIAEYVHFEYELPREIRLRRELEEMYSSEALHYTVRDGYREHMHHAVDCFLTGLLLMDTRLPDGATLFERIAGRLPDKKILLQWSIAALLHDTGYILDISEQSAKHLHVFKHVAEIIKYRSDLAQCFRDLGNELKSSLQTALGSVIQLDQLNHAAISWLHVRSLFSNSRLEPLSHIGDGLTAILKHDHPESSIDPQEEPLSFLLFLCDHLQEWDRPRVDSEAFRRELHQRLYSFPTFKFAHNTPLRFLGTNIHFNETNHEFFVSVAHLEFTLFYRPANLSDSEPVMSWITSCRDFQRIKGAKLRIPITVTLSHPLPSTLERHGKSSELDLFLVYSRSDATGSCLSTWTEKIKTGGLDAVKHCVHIDAVEEFTLCLEKFSHPTTIIDALPKGLYGAYRGWKAEHLRMGRLKKVRI